MKDTPTTSQTEESGTSMVQANNLAAMNNAGKSSKTDRLAATKDAPTTSETRGSGTSMAQAYNLFALKDAGKISKAVAALHPRRMHQLRLKQRCPVQVWRKHPTLQNEGARILANLQP